MKKRTYIKIGMLVILLAVLTITSNVVENKNTIQTSAGVNLDNKKVEWGIRRSDNHEQPDLGSKNKKIIDENEDMAIGNNEEKYVYLNSQPELVERMIQEGHIVGNHTVNHPSMPSLNEEKLKEEVMKLHTTVYEKFGYEMKYLRPPKGEFSERTLWQTKQLGYTTVMWSFAYDDWDENKQGREAYGKEKILKNVHNGAIILLHANSKDNCNILDSVIKEIKNMGYEFKSLDEFKR